MKAGAVLGLAWSEVEVAGATEQLIDLKSTELAPPARDSGGGRRGGLWGKREPF